jgi:Protein of unknown function (DUF3311)
VRSLQKTAGSIKSLDFSLCWDNIRATSNGDNPDLSVSHRLSSVQLDLELARPSKTYMKRILLIVAVVALYALHQDFWFWRTAHPLVFGFVPIGLFYQACYSVAAALLLWLLVKFAWPSHLEREAQGSDEEMPR